MYDFIGNNLQALKNLEKNCYTRYFREIAEDSKIVN